MLAFPPSLLASAIFSPVAPTDATPIRRPDPRECAQISMALCWSYSPTALPLSSAFPTTARPALLESWSRPLLIAMRAAGPLQAPTAGPTAWPPRARACLSQQRPRYRLRHGRTTTMSSVGPCRSHALLLRTWRVLHQPCLAELLLPTRAVGATDAPTRRPAIFISWEPPIAPPPSCSRLPRPPRAWPGHC